MKLPQILAYLFIFNLAAFSQNFPDPKPVYLNYEVSRIDILIPPDSLAKIYADLENVYYYHATFIFNNSLLQHDTITNVGLRLRGTTSLISAKKSFKISFNTYVPGRKYYGLEKLNLNGEHNDPCIIRSKLCWNLCRDFGIPAPRASHTRVYINGAYYGLYINVEHIDENFVKSRFGNNNGNLYKCTYPADLVYLGSDPELYKLTNAYELQTNVTQDDFTDLVYFIDILNNTVSDSLHYKLDQVFNIQSFLKYLAFECITGHWDGYSYNMNNFYLYHNQTTGKFEFIPYDVDNTFGIDWMNIDWGHRNIYTWLSDDPRPLTRRLLQDPYYKKLYTFYVKQFLKDYFNQQAMFPLIDSIYHVIYQSAVTDPYRPLDYGWNTVQFAQSYTQSLGNHVKYGLKPFITTRNSSALQQLIPQNTPALVINEFMAQNTSTVTDNFGDYEDWIEIYNPGNVSVYLGDKYLTDDLNVPDKWQMPAITLDPDNCVLIWADNEVVQGDHHASFKLNKDGEQIGLFTSPADGSIPIDVLTYGSQQADVSTGRYPNGSGITQVLTTPTPQACNSLPVPFNEIQHKMSFQAFPNPFRDILCLSFKDMDQTTPLNVSLLDVTGRIIYYENLSSFQTIGKNLIINTGQLTPGIYFLRIQDKHSFQKTISLIHSL